MSPVPTPTMPGAKAAELKYRGAAMAQLRILKQQMALGGLKIGNRRVDLGDGVECLCEIIFNWEAVYVRVPEIVEDIIILTAVILHPRSGQIVPMDYQEVTADGLGGYSTVSHPALGVAGGWQDGVVELNTNYIYPLVDEDNASFVVSNPGDAIEGVFAGNVGNYGNLYWARGDTVLSWRGTPTRHFRLSSDIEIPGLSQYETAIPGAFEDKPQYTAFGTSLYSGGNVIANAPIYSWPYDNTGVSGRCFILGALRNVLGVVFIVALSDHYNAPDPMPKPGYYLTLWSSDGVGGWVLVSENLYSRNGLPWFGNVSGTEFVCSNGDRLTTAGVLTVKAADLGSYSETFSGDWSFDLAYSGDAYHEFVGDTLTGVPVSVSASSIESATGSSKGSATYTSNLGVLYNLADATLRSRASIGPNNSAVIGTIVCIDGRERKLESHSFSYPYWSDPYIHPDGETWIVANTPDNGVRLVTVWHYGPVDVGSGIIKYNVAEFWWYGLTEPYEAC